MRAIVRTDYHEREFGVKNGDVVEVLDNLSSQVDGAGIYNNPGMGMCSLCKDEKGGLHYIAIRNLEVIDFTPTTDWNQVRIQAAIAAMQGMIISDVYADIEIRNQMTYEKSRKKWDNIKIAKAAVAHADALVAELKKREEQ